LQQPFQSSHSKQGKRILKSRRRDQWESEEVRGLRECQCISRCTYNYIQYLHHDLSTTEDEGMNQGGWKLDANYVIDDGSR